MPRVSLRVLSLLALVSCGLVAPARAVAQSTEAPHKGEVTKYTFDKSKIFPGTVRDY